MSILVLGLFGHQAPHERPREKAEGQDTTRIVQQLLDKCFVPRTDHSRFPCKSRTLWARDPNIKYLPQPLTKTPHDPVFLWTFRGGGATQSRPCCRPTDSQNKNRSRHDAIVMGALGFESSKSSYKWRWEREAKVPRVPWAPNSPKLVLFASTFVQESIE